MFRRHRLTALNSLSIAFGKEKTAKEIEGIARQCFKQIARTGLEVIYSLDRVEEIKKNVRFEGIEHLDEAQAMGKGVILVSAHFGNFPLLLAKLGLEGYKVNTVARPLRNRLIEGQIKKRREKLKITIINSIPRKTCIYDSIHCLRSNECLFVLLDQNFGTGGVFVDFFGTKAATAIGPLVLARRTGAAIVPCFIMRQKDGTHSIVFKPRLEFSDSGNDEEKIFDLVQKITGIIESYIRNSPQEWAWIHRRWKSRPH